MIRFFPGALLYRMEPGFTLVRTLRRVNEFFLAGLARHPKGHVAASWDSVRLQKVMAVEFVICLPFGICTAVKARGGTMGHMATSWDFVWRHKDVVVGLVICRPSCDLSGRKNFWWCQY